MLTHAVAMAVLGFIAWSAALQISDATALALGLNTTSAPVTAWLLYALLQAGRMVHEAGHALAGVVTGRYPRSVRLTPLLMVTDFPDGELETAPVISRRLIALAGSTVEAGFGLALLASAIAIGQYWAPVVQETVYLCGVVHVAALANLLPGPQMDGHVLFGRAWHTRPAWLGLLAVVLLMFPLPLAVTALNFPHGYIRAYVAWLSTPSGYVPLALGALIIFPITRRLLFPPQTASQASRAAPPERPQHAA